MTNKDTGPDDHYEYKETDDAAPEVTEDAQDVATKKRFSAKGLAKNRKVIFVVGFVVVVIVVYNLLGTKESGKFTTENKIPPMASLSAKSPIVPPAVFPQTTQAVPKAKAVVAPMIAPEPVSAPVKTTPNDVIARGELNTIANNIAKDVTGTVTKQMNAFSYTYNQRLNNVQHENATTKSQIALLRQETADLHAELAALQKQYDVVKSNQAVLASNEGYSFNASGVVVQSGGATAQRAAATAQAAEIQYTVQAVVPGRAWLVAADGSMLTVSVGEAVPGMGDVAAINPMNGTVTTTTGKVITSGG